MRFFNDVCCICLSSKKDLKDIHVTDKDGLTYYEVLIACIPEMFEFLEANNTYRQICSSCCNIVDVVFKLYQNYLKSKTILLDNIKKLHETVTGTEDPAMQNNIITIEDGDIKIETIDIEEDSSPKPALDQEEITVDADPPDTLKDDSDEEAITMCEPFIILEEMSNDGSDITKLVENEPELKENHSEPNETSKWDLTCIACHKKFMDKLSLNKHQKFYCNWKEARRPRGRPRKEATSDLKCKFCKRSFKYVNALRVHERLHTGELPFQCSICEKRFRQVSNFNYHMLKHHGQKVPRKKRMKPEESDVETVDQK